MESEAGLTRGFLFADLRGYSAFSESRGDAAAAALLARYRTLVRGVVATAGGAEIRTEGDSFYVVFRSASAAVRAGLAIVEAAAIEAIDHPDAPMTVGVGVHAGEAVDSDEGPIGSAVNITARICAVARPGEVLVSDTVRSLTRSSVDAHFVSRGRPRLKGIDEPIEVFSVVDRKNGPRLVRGSIWSRLPAPATAATAGIAALALIGALALNAAVRPAAQPSSPPPGGEPSSTNATATPEATPMALRFGDLAAGDYVSTRFTPQVHLALPPGWFLVDEIEGRIILSRTSYPKGWDMTDRGWLTLKPGQLVIGSVKAGWNTCTGESVAIGPRSTDVLDWLATNEMVSVGEVEPISTKLQAALRVAIRVTEACADVTAQSVPLLRFLSSTQLTRPDRSSEDGFLRVLPAMAFDLYAIDHQTQAIIVVAVLPADLPDFRSLATVVVRSMSFE